MIEADAELEVHVCKEAIRPGEWRYWQEYEWKGGRVAFVEALCQAQGIGALPYNPKVGTTFRFAGCRVRVVELGWPSRDGVYVVRETGFLSRLWVPYYAACRALRRIGVLFLRTMWAWGMLDYDIGDIATWRNLRPYKWLKRRGAE